MTGEPDPHPRPATRGACLRGGSVKDGRADVAATDVSAGTVGVAGVTAIDCSGGVALNTTSTQ